MLIIDVVPFEYLDVLELACGMYLLARSIEEINLLAFYYIFDFCSEFFQDLPYKVLLAHLIPITKVQQLIYILNIRFHNNFTSRREACYKVFMTNDSIVTSRFT